MRALGVRKAVINKLVEAAKERAAEGSSSPSLDEDSASVEHQNEDEHGDDSGKEDVDLDQLSETDCAHFLEIKAIESRFNELCYAPFNLATLEFTATAMHSNHISLTPLDTISTLDILPAALPATKRLVYRIQGFQHLIAALEGMECSSNVVEARRLDLIYIILVETERLLAAVWTERDSQRSASTLHAGLRRVHLGELKWQSYEY